MSSKKRRNKKSNLNAIKELSAGIEKIDIEKELRFAIAAGLKGKDLELYAAILKSHNEGRKPTRYTVGFDAQGRELVAYSL